jgi:tetratricopeptide (TPR) repeat protein
MWQLLLPPVIVIITFTFLLWFLAKKQSDPFVQEEINRLTEGDIKSLASFRTWFWGVTEKMTKRARIKMLRLHNVLGDWSRVAKENKEQKGPEGTSDAPAPAIQEPVLPRTDITSHAPKTDDGFIERPIVRREVRVESTGANATALRTNVSDIKKEYTSHEEDFIASIAKNPKDYSAYEKLGDYYMENGNIKDAKECYRQVLRLSPANREVKMKIRRLEKMLG